MVVIARHVRTSAHRPAALILGETSSEGLRAGSAGRSGISGFQQRCLSAERFETGSVSFRSFTQKLISPWSVRTISANSRNSFGAMLIERRNAEQDARTLASRDGMPHTTLVASSCAGDDAAARCDDIPCAAPYAPSPDGQEQRERAALPDNRSPSVKQGIERQACRNYRRTM